MIKNGSMTFSAMVPWQLQYDNLFCLPHHNIRWIMKVDNIGMKKKPSAELNIHAWSLLHFFLM